MLRVHFAWLASYFYPCTFIVNYSSITSSLCLSAVFLTECVWLSSLSHQSEPSETAGHSEAIWEITGRVVLFLFMSCHRMKKSMRLVPGLYLLTDWWQAGARVSHSADHAWQTCAIFVLKHSQLRFQGIYFKTCCFFVCPRWSETLLYLCSLRAMTALLWGGG